MSANLLTLIAECASGAPFLAIAAIFIHYCLRRAAWRRKTRRGEKSSGFCPSNTALGMMLLFMQVFVRPSLQHVLEERQEEDADEDDQGDPENKEKHLDRQLKRIRRGEPVEDLVLRL